MKHISEALCEAFGLIGAGAAATHVDGEEEGGALGAAEPVATRAASPSPDAQHGDAA